LAIEDYYIDCTRKRPLFTANVRGRLVPTYAETLIRGYKGSQIDNPIVVGDMVTIVTNYKFFCNDFDLKSNDLIEYEGEIYQVIGKPKNTANKNHHIKVMIQRIEGVTS
jgi:hypothetical protein